jgi:hypothetical protein
MNTFLRWNVVMVACIVVIVLGIRSFAPMLPTLPLPGGAMDVLVWLNVRAGPDWLGATRLELVAYSAGVCYVAYAIIITVLPVRRQDGGKS